MSSKFVSIIYELLDDPGINGQKVVDELTALGATDATVTTTPVCYEAPEITSQVCDFIKVVIKGRNGKSAHGETPAPTMGIIGRLGAQQAQPARTGKVSDSDGSIVALATAMKLLDMSAKGAKPEGDVIITTHIATHVSITPHEPVDFMGMPVSSDTMNDYEVDDEMDAILSVDTSKGNSIIKHRGIAISATAKEGYILRVAPDLVKLLEYATGKPAKTFPITTQDITRYNNGLYHFNSIMQPHVATTAPVAGLAITAGAIVPGCETGASYESELTDATVFAVELAKQFTRKKAAFYDADEYQLLLARYGSMTVLQG
ncbi:DUF1177 domain-containing protein [Salmonella enterica]|uniref:DUF1177 domain-containing protein n=1 Tax=Salmonella enterica subsp. enterica serovar Panama TaxID=29472 RepID=A0A5U8JFS8_SALET|nr:DUF1177 domain-containing protein [Salmonella enterica]EAW1318658.1 DUF1177 domain-containing protein [Salmonella enterica subsp. diarizonae]EBR7997335.1 DUF1177 domain-containing protein [Salmonella enterica subsp. enterica serovar Panama]ECG3787293.1 DUF1177 domain-containing protein [Salmonella enterica subsp. enterica serovar Florida]EIE2750872.1 DUF1177 domain-containing protein [Salmonella enterica subsp. diarizonae serovar 48:i:z]ASD87769.1 hypothetical protein LFZ16_16880 [Salmonell